MKFTFNEVFNIYDTLLNIKSNKFQINYWISRNLKVFRDTYTFIINERNRIYNDFLYFDDNGQYFDIIDKNIYKPHYKDEKPEYIKAFADKMEDLFGTECELEPYLIHPSVLMESDLSISLDQLMAIDKLLE